MIEEYEVPTLDGSWRIDTMQGFWKPVRGWRGEDITPYYNMCVWHGSEAIFTTSTVCFECGHVYRDDADLVREQHRAVLGLKMLDGRAFAHILKAKSADEITFCQHCLHDF